MNPKERTSVDELCVETNFVTYMLSRVASCPDLIQGKWSGNETTQQKVNMGTNYSNIMINSTHYVRQTWQCT